MDSSSGNPDRRVRIEKSRLCQPSDISPFRYGVIAELVHLPVGTPGLIARMRDKAAQTYAIPGTTRTQVAANTIRDWIKLYRDGGFEALYPKPRSDRGQPRRMPPEVATRLIALKRKRCGSPTFPICME